MTPVPAVPAPFADEQIILGVDTHNDVHVAAVITTLDVLVGSQPSPTTAAGYAALMDWGSRHGTLRRVGARAPAPTAPRVTPGLPVLVDQLPSVHSLIPRSRATYAIGLPVSRKIRTALSRNTPIEPASLLSHEPLSLKV